MEQIRDHPDIERIERFGYAKMPKAIYTCSWCDEPIYVGEECFDMRPYGWCCERCMNERLTTAEAD